MNRHRNPALWFAVAAAASFLAALLLAGIGVPEFSHRIHPLALRGAAGLPGAMLFNAFAFLLPGIALVLAAQALRPVLAGGWSARIGLVLAQISALAFGLQGALPMAMEEIDSAANRLHVLAWMLWWIAFVPAMLLLAFGARRGIGFTVACLLVGALVPVIAVLAPIGAWVGLAQRLVFGLWFGWWLLAALRLGRSRG